MSNMFKDRLNALFRESGKSIEATAKEIGTTKQGFNNWLSGKSEPKLEYLVNISLYYDITIDYLLGKSNNKTHQKRRNSEYIKSLEAARATITDLWKQKPLELSDKIQLLRLKFELNKELYEKGNEYESD